MPSIIICPAVGSTIRKSACTRVVLPLPVLPTMPVFLPPRKVHVRPRNTSGMCGAYRTYIQHIIICYYRLHKIHNPTSRL
jgi:hypothetical protein